MRYWGILFRQWQSFPNNDSLAALAICVGFGLILAASGSRAKGRWGLWTVSGSGALAIILYLLLESYLKPGFTKYGGIEGDLSKVADLRIVDDHPLYAYRDQTTRSIQFIMLKDKFMHPRVGVQVDTTEKEEGKIFFEMIGDGDKISKKHVGQDWEASIRWDFDYRNRIVRDGNDVIFKEVADQNEIEIIPPKKGELSSRHWSNIFWPAALAQSIDDNHVNSSMLVRNLMEDDPRVRRNARDALIAFGASAVPPMLEAWHRDAMNYRTKLGVVVVINNMLRNDANMGGEIFRRLNTDDIHLLVNAASDSDKTVRVQATELLYAIKDKRVVSDSLDAVRQNSSESSVYNNVLILKCIVSSLDHYERKRVKDEVMSLVP